MNAGVSWQTKFPSSVARLRAAAASPSLAYDTFAIASFQLSTSSVARVAIAFRVSPSVGGEITSIG
jgi:hypothetical protein